MQSAGCCGVKFATNWTNEQWRHVLCGGRIFPSVSLRVEFGAGEIMLWGVFFREAWALFWMLRDTKTLWTVPDLVGAVWRGSLPLPGPGPDS